MRKSISFLFLVVFNLNACNLVPVIKSFSEGKKAEIYQFVCNNSFPCLQNKLNGSDISAVCSNPRAFMETQIREQDPGADISFLPKSLYQLFVFDCLLHKIEALNPVKDFFQICELVLPLVSNERDGICFNTNECPDYSAYANRASVQSFFWESNDFIIRELIAYGANTEPYDKDLLSQITFNLLTGIKRKCDLLLSKKVDVYEMRYPMRKFPDEPNSYLSQKVSDLIFNEYQTIDEYIIYRAGDEFDLSHLFKLQKYSCSFSDCLFGAPIYDSRTGSAFALWGERPLIVMHISFNDLLTQRNGAEIFNIPPIMTLAATLGYGEFHHVRTRVFNCFNNEESAKDLKGVEFYKAETGAAHPELWIDSKTNALASLGSNYETKPVDETPDKNYRVITIKKKIK